MNFYHQVAEQHLEATRRVFFTCRACQHRWVHAYFAYAGKWYRLTPTYLYALEEDARCPVCQSRLVKYEEVHSKLAQKLCGEECLMATGPTCCCSCGGANHGKGRVEVI